MENHEVLERTLQSYEDANGALLMVWDSLDPETRDYILKKQQNRLEQIADRMYHEDRTEQETEVMQNTLVKYAWANQYLSEHWETLPSEERLSLMRKQWQRLEELRKRNH